MTRIPSSECHSLKFSDLQAFECLNSPIWIYDLQQQEILWANTAAFESCDVSSLDVDEIQRVQVKASPLPDEMSQVSGTEKVNIDWTVIHSDKIFTFSSLCSRIYLDNNHSVVLVEATAKADASNEHPSWNEKLLQQQTKVLEKIATHQSLTETFKELVITLETLMPNRIGSFLLYDSEQNCLGSGYALSLPRDYVEALHGLPVRENAGCCGTAAYRKEPVIVDDIATDSLWEEFRDLALSHNLRAAWSYPILGENGALLGTFCAYSRKVEAPTEADLRLTNLIRYLAALAITQDQVRRERDQKLALVEAAVDGIGMVEKNVFCYLNQAHAEIFGYDSPEELMGVHWRELYNPEEAARLEQDVLPILVEQGYWRGCAIAQRKDGTTFPQELSLTLVDQEKIICVGQDISDRVAAELALQNRDQYLQSLTYIQQKLLTTSDLNLAAYQDILSSLGETAKTSRAYFFQADCNEQGEWLVHQQAEWCAEGVQAELQNPALQNVPVARVTPLLLETLLAKEIYCHDVVDLPPSERDHLHSQDIQSILVFPLFVNNNLFGFIGFDQCDRQREWKSLEMNFLCWASNAVAIAQENQKSQEALIASEHKYRGIFENITQGIFQVTLDGTYLSVNPFLADLYGYDSPEDLMNSITNLARELYVDPKRRHKLAQLTLEYGTVKNFESQVYRKDSAIIWVSVTQHAVYDEQGRFLYFEGVVEDITARKKIEDQLYYQAFHDGLTQLSNRTWFVQRLEGAIHNYRQSLTENCYAVFFIDLDRFKMINDSLGHIVGDKLLKKVARRLEAHLPNEYLLARFGGDEFALLATNIKTQADCHVIAQQLMGCFQDPFLLKGYRYFVGVSIGIALGDLYYQTPEELLRDADAAMYEAKAKGGGYVFFQPEIRERILSCLLLENDLDGAIQREEFQLRYQPLVYLATNQLYGFEVLLRWLHPQRGAISPTDFIPIAEETGVINELDAWVLRQSCRQLQQWQKQFPTAQDLVISVNLSPVELLQSNLVAQIATTLREEGVSPHCIRLEVTETTFLDQTRLHVFQQLQALGVQISIDDFGTGESSLSRLHQLPLSTIKLDRVFVQQLDQGHSGKAIVQTILGLAKSLGVNVLSEGIETAQQRDMLLELGCFLGQGYFYAPPVPVNIATAMLASSNIAEN